MKTIAIKNLTRSLKHPLRVGYCESFLCKLRGLSFKGSLEPQQGLLLVDVKPGRMNTSIHMFGMFFDLSIIWLDHDLTVVDKILAKRWLTIAFPRKPARYVIECAVSRYEEFKVGDQLAFENVK